LILQFCVFIDTTVLCLYWYYSFVSLLILQFCVFIDTTVLCLYRYYSSASLLILQFCVFVDTTVLSLHIPLYCFFPSQSINKWFIAAFCLKVSILLFLIFPLFFFLQFSYQSLIFSLYICSSGSTFLINECRTNFATQRWKVLLKYDRFEIFLSDSIRSKPCSQFGEYFLSFGLESFVFPYLVQTNIMIKIYRTTILSVVLCGCECHGRAVWCPLYLRNKPVYLSSHALLSACCFCTATALCGRPTTALQHSGTMPCFSPHQPTLSLYL